MRDDGWVDRTDDDIGYQKTIGYALQVGQSPQLRERDPTFWIVNAVDGIRAAPCVLALAIGLYKKRSAKSDPRGNRTQHTVAIACSPPLVPAGFSDPVPGAPASGPSCCCWRSDDGTAPRVMGRPRASALPERTMRTFNAGRRVVSSNNSCDADAELRTDWRSMSREGCGEPPRARKRLILVCC